MNKLNTVATVLVALLTLVDVGHNIGIILWDANKGSSV